MMRVLSITDIFNPIPVKVVALVLTAVSYVSYSYVKVNSTEI